MSFCTNCGKQLDENAKFCSGCGKMVEQIVEPEKEVEPEQISVVEEKKLKTVLLYDISKADKFKLLKHVCNLLEKDLSQTVEFLKKMPVKVVEGVNEDKAEEVATVLRQLGALCEVYDADMELCIWESDSKNKKEKSIKNKTEVSSENTDETILTTTQRIIKEQSSDSLEPKKLQKRALIKSIVLVIGMISMVLAIFLPFISKKITVDEVEKNIGYSLFSATIEIVESIIDGTFISGESYMIIFSLLRFMLIIPLLQLIPAIINGIKQLIRFIKLYVKLGRNTEINKEKYVINEVPNYISFGQMISIIIEALFAFYFVIGFYDVTIEVANILIVIITSLVAGILYKLEPKINK